MGTRQDLISARLPLRSRIESILFGFRQIFVALSRGRIVTFLALALLEVILAVVFPLLNRTIIDAGVRLSAPEGTGALAGAIAVLGAFFGAQLANAAVELFGSAYNERVFSIVNDAMQETMIRKCCRLRARYFADGRFIDRFSLVNREVGGRTGSLITHVVGLSVAVASCLGLAALIFATDWIAGLVSIAAVLPAIFLYRRQNDIQYAEAYWEMPSYKQMDYALCLLTDREHAAERVFHNLKSHLLGRWDAARRWVVGERLKLNSKLAAYNLVVSVTMTLGFALSLLIVTLGILRGEASVGVFALMTSAIQGFHAALARITRSALEIGNNAKYIHDFTTFLACEEEPRAAAVAVAGRPAISFRDVHFGYPGTGREVLRGITVDIAHGEKVAIVGKNGSGKSTFVSLLTGIYEPDAGEIRFGGAGIAECLGEARRLISCAYQDFGRYEMSIADNIRIWDWGADLAEADVERIARMAGIDELVEGLPQRFDTWLGTLGERACDLSGGQWQRLAIARVLARSGAQVMILDEPMAALDPKTEARLYEDFEELTGGRTTLLISHRLGIARKVDRILVFDDGRIVEDGSHERLMADGGLYATLYRTQAQWYR